MQVVAVAQCAVSVELQLSKIKAIGTEVGGDWITKELFLRFHIHCIYG